ncbi:MAG: hypothetical protein V4488_24095 [Pseudomonadota bacterium]
MSLPKAKKQDANTVTSNPAGEAGQAAIPSSVEEEMSIGELNQDDLGDELQGQPEESIDAEREASLNKDEPDLELDKLDPVPPK